MFIHSTEVNSRCVLVRAGMEYLVQPVADANLVWGTGPWLSVAIYQLATQPHRSAELHFLINPSLYYGNPWVYLFFALNLSLTKKSSSDRAVQPSAR